MSSGWLQVNKTAEGGPRVMRKVRPTYFPGKATHAVDFSKFQGKQILVPKIEQFENSEIKLKGCVKKKSPKWLLIFMSNSPFLYKEVKGNLLGESCSSCHLESYFPFNYNVRLSRRKWLLAQVIGRFEKIGLREILIPLYMERYPVYSQAFSQLAIWLYCRCQLFVEYFLCICSLRTKWLWLEAEFIKSNLAHGFKFHLKILILAIVTIDRVDSFQIKQNKFKMWLSFFLRKRMLKMMYNLLWWRSGIISCQISLMQRWRNWRKGSWLKHSEFI